MHAAWVAAMMAWGAAALAADAPEIHTLTPAVVADAFAFNPYRSEENMRGVTFRFVGVPAAVQRGTEGPVLRYQIEAGLRWVEARLVRGTEAFAATIEWNKPVTLVCTGGGSGDWFPYVSACRPETPIPPRDSPPTPQ